MHRIDGPGATVDNKFTEGDPVGGVEATTVTDDWLNDVQEEVISVLTAASIAPVKGTQNQLLASIQALLGAALTLSSSVVANVRNARMYVSAVSASATFTADAVVVSVGLAGRAYRLASFNKTVNLATTGAGGMDTGTAPVNGYVALYAIYNPTTAASALLAVNATSAVAPEVYGGANMPSGYTASALVSVWATNASSQFKLGLLRDRRISITEASALSTSTNVATPTALSLASIIPMNAKSVAGSIGSRTTSVPSNSEFEIGADTNFVGRKKCYGVLTVAGQTSSFIFETQIATAQTIYYAAQVPVGTPTHTMFISEYSF